MKIYIHRNVNNNTVYTTELLKHIAKKNGHSIVSSPDESDIVCFSIVSFDEIDKLRVFRNRNKNAKIIAGGHACNNPAALLRYVDYVNLGQGFEFFRDCKTIDDIYDKEYIVHKEKKHGKFSHYIDWSIVPLVQISVSAYSILYSTGCRRKCKFCMTSWINKYQVNENKKNLYAAKKHVGNKQLYLITNDFDHGVNINRNVSDVTYKEYIDNPGKYEDIKLLRMGIESPVDDTRKFLGKNIRDEEISLLLKVLKKNNKSINFFFICGLDSQESWERFSELLDYDIDNRPRIGLILNYFSPQRLTPLETYNLTNIIHVNIPEIKRVLKVRNARIVIFRDLKISPYNSVYTSILSRCGTNQVDDILKLKSVRYNSLQEMFSKASDLGLLELIEGKLDDEYKITVG